MKKSILFGSVFCATLLSSSLLLAQGMAAGGAAMGAAPADGAAPAAMGAAPAGMGAAPAGAAGAGAAAGMAPRPAFADLDKDANGYLMMEEFLMGMPEEMQARTEGAFGRMDTNTDGMVTAEEYDTMPAMARPE